VLSLGWLEGGTLVEISSEELPRFGRKASPLQFRTSKRHRNHTPVESVHRRLRCCAGELVLGLAGVVGAESVEPDLADMDEAPCTVTGLADFGFSGRPM
jgi:hypothetical protein